MTDLDLLKKIAAGKTLEDVQVEEKEKKKNEIINQLDSYEEKKASKASKVNNASKKSYKSLVKTDKEYMGHPVYEIEFSNGLKILGAKVNGKLIQLKKKSKEVNYGDLVQNELGEWMKDSTTKSRNKRWAEYYKATIKMV